MKVYDIRGKLARTLVEDLLEAGVHRVFWDEKNDSGQALTSGVYFYRLNAGEYVQTRKIVLLK